MLHLLKILSLLYIVVAPLQSVNCTHSLKATATATAPAPTPTTTTTTSRQKLRRLPTTEHHDTSLSVIKLTQIPQRFSRRPPDGDRDANSETNTRRNHRQQHYLPTGPPPYRPPSLLVSLNSRLAQKQLLHLPTMKLQLQQRKIYYTFLDILRTLHRLADHVARGKLHITGAKLHLLKSMIGKIGQLGGQSTVLGGKLRWPLVLLNPHFLKELLSNPTFLVMLFHAIEVGYMSSPKVNLWLRPLVELVKQPSPEKEERTWWRRKRLYETFNGIGSSELQPNLKTIHFRQPGRPAQISVPALSQLFPNFYDKKLLQSPQQSHGRPTMTTTEMMMVPPGGSEQQLLSQEEFEGLDESEKERIIQEAKQNLEESLWTNELIQQQNTLVDSLLQNKLDDSANLYWKQDEQQQQVENGQGSPAEIDQTYKD